MLQQLAWLYRFDFFTLFLLFFDYEKWILRAIGSPPGFLKGEVGGFSPVLSRSPFFSQALDLKYFILSWPITLLGLLVY